MCVQSPFFFCYLLKFKLILLTNDHRGHHILCPAERRDLFPIDVRYASAHFSLPVCVLFFVYYMRLVLFCFSFLLLLIPFFFFLFFTFRVAWKTQTAHFVVSVPSSPAPVRRSTGSSFMRPTASSVAKDKDIGGPVLVKSSIRPAAATSVAQRTKIML